MHTGRVLVDRRLRTIPLIDGRTPPFLTSTGYYGNRYAVFRAVRHATPRSTQPLEVKRAEAPLQGAKPPLPAVTSAFAAECLLIIGDQGPDERFFPSAISPIQKRLASYGLTRQYYVRSGGGVLAAVPVPAKPSKEATPPDGKDLRKAAKTLASGSDGVPTCPDIMILIAGHGTQYAKNGQTAVGRVSGPGTDTEFYVNGEDLLGILTDNPGTTFKLKIDSCFSGHFFDFLGPKGKYPNLLVLESSSNSEEPSWFKGGTYVNYQNGKVFDDGLSPQQAAGQTDLFTDSNLAGWEAFATSAREIRNAQSAGGSLLARMIEAGYTLGKDADVARVKDITHPELLSNMAVSSPLRISAIDADFVEALRATTYTVPSVGGPAGREDHLPLEAEAPVHRARLPEPKRNARSTAARSRPSLHEPRRAGYLDDRVRLAPRKSPDGCDHMKAGRIRPPGFDQCRRQRRSGMAVLGDLPRHELERRQRHDEARGRQRPGLPQVVASAVPRAPRWRSCRWPGPIP